MVGSEREQQAIQLSIEAVVPEEETPIRGWVLISINKWDLEQERVVVLTDTAFYRVKFDFDSKQVVHFARTALLEVEIIQKGHFFGTNSNHRAYGMRVYKGSRKGCQTFCVRSEAGDIADQETLVTIIHEFATARRALSESNFCVSDYGIERSNPLGPITTTYNRMRMGLWEDK